MLLIPYILAWLLTSPVTLSVNPRVCFEPCDITLRIRIEPHDANTMLRVLVDGPHFYSYSEIGLHAKSPTLFMRPIKGLPDGEYGIVVDLVRHDARDWIAGRAETSMQVGGAQ